MYFLETISQIHYLFTYLFLGICMYVGIPVGGVYVDVPVYACMYDDQKSVFTLASQQPSTLFFETWSLMTSSPIG